MKTDLSHWSQRLDLRKKYDSHDNSHYKIWTRVSIINDPGERIPEWIHHEQYLDVVDLYCFKDKLFRPIIDEVSSQVFLLVPAANWETMIVYEDYNTLLNYMISIGLTPRYLEFDYKSVKL